MAEASVETELMGGSLPVALLNLDEQVSRPSRRA
jgi:hypothetical protein